jgi:hypothetical protein
MPLLRGARPALECEYVATAGVSGTRASRFPGMIDCGSSGANRRSLGAGLGTAGLPAAAAVLLAVNVTALVPVTPSKA